MIQQIKEALIRILEYIRYKRSYAQDGEDMVLDSFFEGQKNYKGFYVDIGAHHPVRFSNTNYFYKRGWRGINIDPTPGSMRPFRWLRPGDTNLEIGIGGESGVLRFFCFNDPALNTFDVTLAQERNTGRYKITKTVEVPIEPLGKILDQYASAETRIDFFTIDVEGLDLAVLQSNDWSRYQPTFILVEDIGFSIEKAAETPIYQFLSDKGYKIVAVLKRTIIYQVSDLQEN